MADIEIFVRYVNAELMLLAEKECFVRVIEPNSKPAISALPQNAFSLQILHIFERVKTPEHPSTFSCRFN